MVVPPCTFPSHVRLTPPLPRLQNRLLRNLGVSPRHWTLVPTAIAALVTAPVLTAIGTFTSLYMASLSLRWCVCASRAGLFHFVSYVSWLHV